MTHKISPATGYSRVAKTVLQEGASRVQEMHQAIAGKSFNVLKKLPLVNGPAQLVQNVHDAIAGAVYTTIRRGGGGLLDLAAAIERRSVFDNASGKASSPPAAFSRLAGSVRSALNAAFGDHFADTNSVLAIPMSLQMAGHTVPLERAALALAYPAASQKLCLFIHGLGFDEHCWTCRTSGEGDNNVRQIDLTRQLAADTAYTSLTLRYNSGLPIVENGARLAMWLETLLETWPQKVGELLIIGHSMGGLLARSACAQAAEAQMGWLDRTRVVICLGSPHLGSPLEKLGHLTTTSLRLSSITEPLARIAARRSQGIQDLRHGLQDRLPTSEHIAWRFIAGSLATDPDNPLGELIGDGLVTQGSAAPALSGDVQSIRLGGVGHMGLLTDARVYAQIRAWLPKSGPRTEPLI